MVIRVRWGHEGEAPRMGIGVYKDLQGPHEKSRRPECSLPPSLCHVRHKEVAKRPHQTASAGTSIPDGQPAGREKSVSVV